jgi:hypothetical protein
MDAGSLCGNGVIDPGEECDGSNLAGRTCGTEGFTGGTLGCTPQCKLDTSLCGECNDGVVEKSLSEDCDFGSMGPIINDTCMSLGYPTPGSPGCLTNCKYDLAPCQCGDGKIEGMEQCDGTDLNGHTCASEGFTAGTLSCDATCKLVTTSCTKCGNGVAEPGEQCDGTDLGGHTCVSEGFVGGTLGCDASCKLVTTGCTKCGNGVVDPGEQCDGTNLGGHTCVSEGFAGGTLGCNASCNLVTTGCTKCGNGVIDPGEQCDGTNLGGQTCVTQGFSGGTLSCSPTCTLVTSGCASSCDPDGVYTITMGGPVSYTCCNGNVAVDVTSFSFSLGGAQVDSSPSDPVAMTGAATTCPSGSFDVSGSIPGGCTEHYELVGMFTGPNTWTGTYKLSFTGSQCSCLGGALGSPCVNQSFPITASR